MRFFPSSNQAKWALASILPIATFFVLFPQYIQGDSFFWICLLTLPISIIRDTSHRFPFYSLCLAIGLATFFVPTTIGTYVFVCSLLLFMGQQMTGGVHFVGLVHLFLASPFFTYVSSLVSFPIRLQLSKAVASLLRLSGMESSAVGNIIYIENHSFLVDQACSGMYLLSYSMLFGTLILSMRIRKKTMRWTWMMMHYILLLSLIVWGNLVRIYFLVMFNIVSDHWMHDGIGLIVYMLQILLPFYFVLNRSANGEKKVPVYFSPTPEFPQKKYGILVLLLLLLVTTVKWTKAQETLNEPVVSLTGFNAEIVKTNVTKLSNDHALIYLKSPVAPYSADHNPIICWSGSGYEFQKVEKLQIGIHTVNASELKKGDEVLYTAWWFESSASRTDNQWDWRLRALKDNEAFYLINLTCSTRDELKKQTQNLINQNILLQNQPNS